MARKRQPLTITDEGDDMFVVTVGDKYTAPDYRWSIIGMVMEWLTEGDDLDWLQTADEHKEGNQIVQRLMREYDRRKKEDGDSSSGDV